MLFHCSIMKLTNIFKTILFGVVLLYSGLIRSQSLMQDNPLFGKYTILFSKDANGEIIKDEFYGKKYMETFTRDGRVILDPQFFRDDLKRNGITEPLDYSLIPSVEWKTISDEVLIIITGQGNQEVRYSFAGDTLLLGYPNGHTKYMLRRK